MLDTFCLCSTMTLRVLVSYQDFFYFYHVMPHMATHMLAVLPLRILLVLPGAHAQLDDSIENPP